ncbi:MAG: phosphopantothenate synthase, partial [Betaproteobacteria bacterium]|nr:phosphopantothenate synthase [Betaproteobacteria bacterium]
MNDLHGKRIVLGLTGGIACFKAAELCRSLVKAGAQVQVVMTEAAAQFITPVTMQALSGQAVYTSQWDAREGNNMAHINLSREADLILIAPASADFMAKLIHGKADELLSLMCLARPLQKVPLMLAPAMNREMWAHPGFAMARAAQHAGAKVTLVAGPVSLPTPRGVLRIDVRSALQMHDAVKHAVEDANVFIAAAAVADWRPASAADQKIKKDGSGETPELSFVENPDILATVAKSPRAQSG